MRAFSDGLHPQNVGNEFSFQKPPESNQYEELAKRGRFGDVTEISLGFSSRALDERDIALAFSFWDIAQVKPITSNLTHLL